MKKKILAVLMAMLMMIGLLPAEPAQAAAVKLNKTSLTLTVGDTFQLKVTGKTKKVIYNTDQSKVISIGKTSGLIKAKNPGKANAVVTVKRAGKKDTVLKCKVIVNEKAPTLGQYWSDDSPTAQEIRDYVAKVTNPKDTENFIPVEDRIAVFDMDGTLTCETFFTYYDTMMFIEFCLVDHPERVSEDLKQVARSIAPGYVADESLARNFAKAYAGMTPQELYDYALSFGKKSPVSFTGMRYCDGYFLPMLEIVKYLSENDFTIYVSSGTERTTTRAILAQSPLGQYISPEHVMGTQFEVKLKGHETVSSDMDVKYNAGDQLVYTGGFVQKNLNSSKVIVIEREIGKKPVLCFGNSGSDSSMMAYTIDQNKYPAESFMLIADDNVRDWPNQDFAEKSAEFGAMGFHCISTKNEFKQMYIDGVEKGASQTAPVAPAA
ncbi:MAG: haloacid dehalogenase-like hydrolase [Eubacterium sp.]|nr:haloacid dehalogenase-like hydrolase [Eubacterium sp.]